MTKQIYSCSIICDNLQIGTQEKNLISKMKKSPLNRKTTLRRVSDRRAAELRVYNSMRRIFLQNHPCCEIPSRDGLPSCMKRSAHIHHAKGRLGKLLNDTRWWWAVCNDCHAYLHEHGKESRMKGLML